MSRDFDIFMSKHLAGQWLLNSYIDMQKRRWQLLLLQQTTHQIIPWESTSVPQRLKLRSWTKSHQLLFADYERHFANIQETLASLLLGEATDKLGETDRAAGHHRFRRTGSCQPSGSSVRTQEVIAVSSSLQALAPQTQTLPSSSAARMPKSSILKAAMSNSV